MASLAVQARTSCRPFGTLSTRGPRRIDLRFLSPSWRDNSFLLTVSSTTMQNPRNLPSCSPRIVQGVANNLFSQIAFGRIRSCTLQETASARQNPGTDVLEVGLESVLREKSGETRCVAENRDGKPSYLQRHKIPEVPRQSKVHLCVTELSPILLTDGVCTEQRFQGTLVLALTLQKPPT
jgi:hypothetical protein